MGAPKKTLLRNLRLARILQTSDWDSVNETPIMYEPPSYA